MTPTQCPCNSTLKFNKCCEPFLLGTTFPKTAEALMRSRYTAFTLKNVAYIQKTMGGPAASKFNALETLEWLEDVEWLSLSIISTEDGSPKDTAGVVEFQANYKKDNHTLNLLERSTFKKINDRWFYVDGEHF